MKRAILKAAQRLIGGSFLFRLIEKNSLKNDGLNYPPIFIIGPPRSGTTILYQLLVKHFDLCFFSNASNFFYKAPVTIDRVTSFFSPSKEYQIRKSEFGLVKGLTSPSEAGGIFRYWFDKLSYTEETKDWIRRSILTLSNEYECPFISKNLYNNFRISKILQIFPNALFVYVNRETLFNAQSLLLARDKQNGDLSVWFGLKPIDYSKIIKIDDPYLQVFSQIYSIKNTIDNSLKKNNINFVNISYEELCQNTENVILKLKSNYERLSGKRIKLSNKSIRNINSNNIIKLDEDKWEKLKETFYKE